MTRIAQELKYNLVFWSVVDGLVDTQKATNNSANDPLEALTAIRDLKEKTLILLRDFHLFLQDPNPILIRQLKDVLQMAKTKSKTLIILGCRMVLPPELERELTVIEFALPGKEGWHWKLNHLRRGTLRAQSHRGQTLGAVLCRAGFEAGYIEIPHREAEGHRRPRQLPHPGNHPPHLRRPGRSPANRSALPNPAKPAARRPGSGASARRRQRAFSTMTFLPRRPAGPSRPAWCPTVPVRCS